MHRRTVPDRLHKAAARRIRPRGRPDGSGRRVGGLLGLVLLSVLAVGPGAAAQVAEPGPIRVVIGIADPAHAGADALALSRAVLKQGGEAQRLESPLPDQLHQALDQARRQAGAEDGQLIIALSAGLREEGGAIMLDGFGAEAIPLTGVVDLLMPAGPDGRDPAVSLGRMALPAVPGVVAGETGARILLLLEGCGAETRIDATAMPIRPGLAIGLVPGADMTCDMAEGPGPLAVMADLIAARQPLAALGDHGAFGWFHDPATPLEKLLPLTGMAEAAPAVADHARQPIILGEAASVSRAGSGDVILLPSGAGTAMRAVTTGSGNAAPYRADRRQQQAPAPSAGTDGLIQQVSAPADARRPPRLGGNAGAGLAPVTGTGQAGAMAPRPGMPQPSIIVGHLTAATASQAAYPGLLSGDVLDIGAETRHRLRLEDPDLFSRLLAEGNFDPAPDEIVSAIQTDLARMGCYHGAVDGVWGNGSRVAVSAYLSEIGVGPASQEADIALFRQIAGGPEIRCPSPDPVTAPASPPAVAATGGGGGQPRAAAPAATGGAPANAGPASGPNAGGVRGNLSNAIRGSGIIR